MIQVRDIQDFVKKFQKEKEFEKEFGCPIDEWQYEVSDEEAIRTLLSKEHEPTGLYHVEYFCNDSGDDGYFMIYVADPSLDLGRIS